MSAEPPAALIPLSRRALADALRDIEGSDVVLESIAPIAADRAATELKHIGYGEPLLLGYRGQDGPRRAVLHRMSSNWFGHDRRADRAALALLAADTYGRMPGHVRVLDVGAFREDGSLVSLQGTGDFYVLTTYAEGSLYAQDLRRIEERREADARDVARATSLADYLVALHEPPLDAPPELYVRSIRDLLGSGEGIFGITDSYPEGGPVPRERLVAIERACVDWRWKLRCRAARLRTTHGDFHPYNILFRDDVAFTMLDASRGCVGDPADDVAALVINYLFGAVLYPEAWERGLRPIWEAFWERYLRGAGAEVLEVIAPFFAWRALVVASPVWYPDVAPAARDKLLAFAEDALASPPFDPASVARFL